MVPMACVTVSVCSRNQIAVCQVLYGLINRYHLVSASNWGGGKTSCNYLLFQIFGWVVWWYVSCWRVVYWTEDRRCLTRMDTYALFFHSVTYLLNAAMQFQHTNKHFYVWHSILRNIVTGIIHEDRRHSNPLWMAWSSIFCTTYWEIYLTEPQTNSSETLEI